MRIGSLLLVLAVASLSAQAIAQEIVIEPTNGRTPSATHVLRPATLEKAPAKTAKSRIQEQHSPQKQSVKRRPEKEKVAVNSKSPVVASPAPAVPEVTKDEAAPAPRKVLPLRPAWAMIDTRDAHSIQSEIANALARDPRLLGSSVEVKVDEDSVTLTGRAAGIDQRLQAERLAQSYAWNRKLVDHLEIVPRVSAHK